MSINPVKEYDQDMWEKYPHQRWVFNKLEVALRLGYDAGPACVIIPKPNDYIIRPIYNLYGMGIGAKKMYLDPNIHGEEIDRHQHIPPGHFWCEYFDGDHYSVDYRKENGKWIPFSATIGFHSTQENFVKFSHWRVIDPPTITLPNFIHDLDARCLNLEAKGDKIFEIHLRGGNNEVWDCSNNTILYPAWDNESRPELKHLTLHKNSDPIPYNADGHLDDVRIGYYIDTSKC